MLDGSFTDFDKFGDAELSEFEQQVEQANQDFSNEAAMLDRPKPKQQEPVKPKKGETKEDRAVRETLQAMESDDPLVQLTACVKAMYAIKSRDSAQFDSIGDIPDHKTDQLAHEAATSPYNDLPEPTLEQKISGDYAKGHLVIAGMSIAIENPQRSVRSGTDTDGTGWSVTMKTHYGYFEGTKGADGDEVDVILMPGTERHSIRLIPSRWPLRSYPP